MIRKPKTMIRNLSNIKILSYQKKKKKKKKKKEKTKMNRHVRKVYVYLESSECGNRKEESDSKEKVTT